MTTLKVLMVFNAISFVPFSQFTPLRSTRQLGKQVIFCLITKTYHKTEVHHKYNYQLNLFSFSSYLRKKIHEAIKTNRFLELVGRKRLFKKKPELFAIVEQLRCLVMFLHCVQSDYISRTILQFIDWISMIIRRIEIVLSAQLEISVKLVTRHLLGMVGQTQLQVTAKFTILFTSVGT